MLDGFEPSEDIPFIELASYTIDGRGLWAQRICAEQNNLSNTFGIQRMKTEVVAMAKHVLGWIRMLIPAALVFTGWCAFIGGVVVQTPWLKVALLSVAKILPTAL